MSTWYSGYLLHHLRGGPLHFHQRSPDQQLLTEVGNFPDYLASKAAFAFNFRGPAVGIQASCSSGLAVAHAAISSLRSKQSDSSDMALAGSSSIVWPRLAYVYQDGYIFSKDGRVRSFDAKAGGTAYSDGVGCVVLRRSEPMHGPESSEVMPRAVVQGIAMNNDGRSKQSFAALSVDGIMMAMRAALHDSGRSLEEVAFVECHAMGTAAGDPIEVEAVKLALAQRRKAPLFLTCAKTSVGHANAAAGMVALLKTCLCLEHQQLPPLANFCAINPKLEIDGLQIPTTLVTLHPAATAIVNSLGVGGTNVAALVAPFRADEQGGQAESERMPQEVCILTVSARESSALATTAARLAEKLEKGADLRGLEEALMLAREVHPLRAAVSASDPTTAARLLRQVTCTDSLQPGALVLVFPGIGSQHAHMGQKLAEECPVFASVFHACLEECECKADCHTLHSMEAVHASIFSFQVALWTVLERMGLAPSLLLPHSLGLFAALVVAGALSRRDAAKLVALRGRLIDEHAPSGCLLAVRGLTQCQLQNVIDKQDGNESLSIAVHNGPEDIVVSGKQVPVEILSQQLKREGVQTSFLDTRFAVQSLQLQRAAEQLELAASQCEFQAIREPMLCNITGQRLQRVDARYLSQHMLSPVRFDLNMHAVAPQSLVLEVGPQQQLQGILCRGLAGRGCKVMPLQPKREPEHGAGRELEFLASAVGKLWSGQLPGLQIHKWPSLFSDGNKQTQKNWLLRLPHYAFVQHQFRAPRVEELAGKAPDDIHGFDLSLVASHALGGLRSFLGTALLVIQGKASSPNLHQVLQDVCCQHALCGVTALGIAIGGESLVRAGLRLKSVSQSGASSAPFRVLGMAYSWLTLAQLSQSWGLRSLPLTRMGLILTLHLLPAQRTRLLLALLGAALAAYRRRLLAWPLVFWLGAGSELHWEIKKSFRRGVGAALVRLFLAVRGGTELQSSRELGETPAKTTEVVFPKQDMGLALETFQTEELDDDKLRVHGVPAMPQALPPFERAALQAGRAYLFCTMFLLLCSTHHTSLCGVLWSFLPAPRPHPPPHQPAPAETPCACHMHDRYRDIAPHTPHPANTCNIHPRHSDTHVTCTTRTTHSGHDPLGCQMKAKFNLFWPKSPLLEPRSWVWAR